MSKHGARSMVLGTALTVVAASAHGQGHDTWRSALLNQHLGDAIQAAGVPDLDRELTSSAMDTSTPGSIIGAYYFVDELDHGGLGPLHVSQFDPAGHRWIHAPPLQRDVAGSAMRVWPSNRHVLVELHLTPSAGQSAVFDRTTLALQAVLPGSALQELHDGSILYSGQMIHFAPTHQATLHAFDFQLRKSVPVFPGPNESAIARKYRGQITSIYAKAPAAAKARIANESLYGPVDDFDREIGTIVEGADGGSLAFTARYDAERLGDIPHEALETAVRCRPLAGAWACRERKLEDEGRRLGIPLHRSEDGQYDDAALLKLLTALAGATASR